jgi:hypothetical protein
VFLLAYVIWTVRRPVDPEATARNVLRMEKVASGPPIPIIGAGAVLANAGVFMVVALKAISQLDPSTIQYVLDWTLFALVSMLPLGVALVMLLLARERTLRMLVVARGWIERHARTIALVVLAVFAASLLHDGLAGLAA